MNIASLLDQVAAGLRMALVLLAVLIVMTKAELGPDVPEETRLRTIGVNSAAWCLVALAVLALSPLRALSLLRHPIPRARCGPARSSPFR